MMFNGKLKAEIASLKAQVNALVVSNTEKDAALALAEKQVKDLRAENASYQSGIRLNRQLLKDAEHTVEVLTEALNAVTAERDALRDAAAAKRAKQLANLRNQPKLRSVA